LVDGFYIHQTEEQNMGDNNSNDNISIASECDADKVTGQAEDAFCLPIAGTPIIDPETEKIVIAD